MIDRMILFVTLIVAAFYFYGTSQIPTLEIGDPLGPKAFPYLIGIGLLISAGWLMLETVRAKKAPQAEPADSTSQDHSHLVLLSAIVAWIGIYFAVFEHLGFLLSTPIFLFVLMMYLNRGKWLANGLTSVIFTVAAYTLFSKVLGVSLAKGILPF